MLHLTHAFSSSTTVSKHGCRLIVLFRYCFYFLCGFFECSCGFEIVQFKTKLTCKYSLKEMITTTRVVSKQQNLDNLKQFNAEVSPSICQKHVSMLW